MAYTDGIPAPESFRLWSAIATIAGAMEQRVWTQTGSSRLFPHLYVLLVAPPGIGKTQAITAATEIIHQSRAREHAGFHIAPDSLTKASLIDTLKDSSRKLLKPNGGLLEYHSMFIAASELGVFVSTHDLEFLSILNSFFDNNRTYRERRRGNNLDIEILSPQLTLLAGTQPSFLGSVLPEEAWGMGTTARLLMIYACVAPKVEVFKVRSKKSELEKELVSGLQQICKVIGQMNWEPEVVLELQKWINDDCKPIPTHSKLQHYLSRRWLYVLKLAMVSAMSDGMRMTIELKDFLRAKLWLFDAEASMPDIFRDMAGRSDSQVLQDMHFFMWSQYARDKKPIHESRVYNWLTTRAHADKIKYIIETAERSGMITRTGLGQLIPRPKHEHGEE